MNSPAHDWDYERLVREAVVQLRALEGRILKEALVHVVKPEFNILYLVFEDGPVAINGQNGGEILGIFPISEVPNISPEPHAEIRPFGPFGVFLGKRLVQARSIGEAWNGHGFEFSFENLPGTTMVVQSMDVADSPPNLRDCLRLGVTQYTLECWLGEERPAPPRQST